MEFDKRELKLLSEVYQYFNDLVFIDFVKCVILERDKSIDERGALTKAKSVHSKFEKEYYEGMHQKPNMKGIKTVAKPFTLI